MIKVKIYNVTRLATNCCYLIDEETGKSAVVDPGDKSDELINQIKLDGGKLEYVMLTHGHYDHIGYAKQLAEMFGAKIVTGRENNQFLSDPTLNYSVFHNINLPEFSADILLEDGQEIMLGNSKIKYIYTPGHTIGCGGYIFDDVYICGDTLFCESYGRTDLPTGDMDKLIKTFEKIRAIDKDYTVIPGHGSFTTLSHEKKYNPLMRRV